MSHHQGMSLVALTNVLLDDPMPRRFHLEPMVRAVELLLQERISRRIRRSSRLPRPGLTSCERLTKELARC